MRPSVYEMQCLIKHPWLITETGIYLGEAFIQGNTILRLNM